MAKRKETAIRHRGHALGAVNTENQLRHCVERVVLQGLLGVVLTHPAVTVIALPALWNPALGAGVRRAAISYLPAVRDGPVVEKPL